MAERIVKSAFIRWRDSETSGRRIAFAGQSVELPSDVEKLEDERGSLYPEGQGPETAAAAADSPVGLDLDTGSVEDAAAWLESEKPKASEVVALAGDDPARAQLLLEAEQQAQGGDGRKTVVEPLRKIIDGE